MQAPLPYRRHDHERCVQDAVNEARELCRQAGTRLTPTREQVLELVWQSHQPLGAYDILGLLNQQGRHAAPPTVYRALDFLQQMGLVHRIASLNAFIGCPHAGRPHQGCFLICRRCGNVLELDAQAIDQAITAQTTAQGFVADDIMLEVAGLCPTCQSGRGTHD